MPVLIKSFLSCVLILAFVSHIFAQEASAVPIQKPTAVQALQDCYLRIFLEFQDAQQKEKSGDYLAALARVKDALFFLEKMRDISPDWESDLVNKRIKEARADVVRLQPLADRQVVEAGKSPIQSGPGISTRLENAFGMEKAGDNWGALLHFEWACAYLEIVHRSNPQWEADLIENKITICQSEISRLQTLILQSLLKESTKHPNL